MATVAGQSSYKERWRDVLSGTPRAHAIDRWIFVFTAALFVLIILTGFIPDSVRLVGDVKSGARPPIPIILHMHAVLMASFMALLLAQTVLMATGRNALHMKVGIASFVIAPAIVVVGLVLVPTMYHQTSDALRLATAPALQQQLKGVLLLKDNIMLLQFRVAILFPLFLALGLKARGTDAGFHKRMMILASAVPLVAGIDRIGWLPKTFPASPLDGELYTLAALAPMFLWDLVRNRRVHAAYLVWLAVNLPFAILVHGLWDKPWWHSVAQRLMGVG